MKVSPRTMAIIYFLLGIFFIYVAILSAEETIWNVTTIILAIFATFEIGVSIRLMGLYLRIKNNKK
jgi:VIT1/CCC1 family predicted Fe2+/Mn2+ transporter